MNDFSLIITEENIGERIDKFISEQDFELTRSAVQKLIDEGNILLIQSNSKNYKLRLNDIVDINIRT